jgi:putative glutamine amidotransferase
MIGAGTVPVNSMHHQGIRQLGAGLVASAVAPDGLIEATESTDDAFFIGVQWHPEALTDADVRMRRIFDEFIAAAAEFRVSREVGSAPY